MQWDRSHFGSSLQGQGITIRTFRMRLLLLIAAIVCINARLGNNFPKLLEDAVGFTLNDITHVGGIEGSTNDDVLLDDQQMDALDYGEDNWSHQESHHQKIREIHLVY